MKPFRILLLSGTRPSRTRRVANRLLQEVKGAKLCGIIQQPVYLLTVVQQCISAGLSQHTFKSLQNSSGMRRCLHSLFRWFTHCMLWWVHGAPASWNEKKEFELTGLVAECQHRGCQFLEAESDDFGKIQNFLRELNPDLIVLLGDLPLKNLPASPSMIRVSQQEQTAEKRNVQLAIEYLQGGSDESFLITSLKVPLQAYDTPIGIALKTDLIADDLLVQTVANLTCRSAAETSKEVNAWIQRMLSPYLEQLHPPSIQQQPSTSRCHRSVWKLCLETALLCSPLFAGRNLYRRLRGRYPVLVLAHHLISDRPHYMGVSTESFWHELGFLRRHYQIVGWSKAVELLRSGCVKVPTVALTFDDGYGENFVNLRAVAEEFGIPITLFVSTEPIDKHLEFEHDLKRGSKGALPLTWDQIQYWDRIGVEVGSHTRTHFDCGSSDRARLEREIVGSRNELEDHLGKKICFFAFPYGKQRNMSSDALQLAADTYVSFASAFGGENLPKRGSCHSHLFRKNFYSHPWELELELQSVFEVVDRIKRWFSPAVKKLAHSGDVSTSSLFANDRELVSKTELAILP